MCAHHNCTCFTSYISKRLPFLINGTPKLCTVAYESQHYIYIICIYTIYGGVFVAADIKSTFYIWRALFQNAISAIPHPKKVALQCYCQVCLLCFGKELFINRHLCICICIYSRVQSIFLRHNNQTWHCKVIFWNGT